LTALALIEHTGADWSGEIAVQTRGGRAEELLRRPCRIVDEARQRFGLEAAIELRQSAIGPTGTRFGPADYEQLRLIEKIAHHAGEILHVSGDSVHPRDFAGFLQHGFEDAPAPGWA
jgi:2,4-dienoyl-CoA reductase-like NADH-dependent reductase (Old Yellow Enzyme family)